MYKILDEQLEGREFWRGHTFKNKQEVIEALINFHDIDFTGTDRNDNELSLKKYFKYWKINTVQKQLNWLLDYGTWKLKKAR